MASLKELQDGLAAADAAGNTADAQAFADAIRSMQAQPSEQAPPPEQRDPPTHGSAATMWDNDPAMALGQGLAKAAISTPGMLSSVREFLGSLEPRSDADRWIAKNIIPSLSNAARSTPVLNQVLYGTTSQELLDMVDKVVPVDKKFTGPSAYIERAGEAYLPGPGGKAQAARDAIAAIGAGFGGKGGSDLARALELGPTAESGADILGSIAGAIASKGKAANEVKIAAKGAPTREALNTATEDAYEAMKPIALSQNSLAHTMNQIDKAFRPAGVKPRHIPDVYGDLEDYLGQPNLNMADIMSTRAEASTAKRYNPNNPHTSKAADIIVDKLDEFIDTATPINAALGKPYKEAKELGRSQAKSRDFDSAIQRGEASQMGEAIGGMNEARALMKRDIKTLSPLEKKGLKNVVGRNARNPLRILGRGFQSFLTQGAGAGVSAATMNPIPLMVSTGLGIAGKGMEGLADRMSMKKLEDLVASIRGGRPKQERATRKATKINKERETAKWRGILGELRANTFGQEE